MFTLSYKQYVLAWHCTIDNVMLIMSLEMACTRKHIVYEASDSYKYMTIYILCIVPRLHLNFRGCVSLRSPSFYQCKMIELAVVAFL